MFYFSICLNSCCFFNYINIIYIVLTVLNINMLFLKFFFLQNCKVYFGFIIAFGNSVQLNPGHVILVLFEPFCTTEALNRSA